MPENAVGEPLPTRVRDVITDSLRYWEPRRILYNFALIVVVAAHFIGGMPHSAKALRAEALVLLFIMAVLANGCYCAAYLADLFVQFSGFGAAWQRRRWLLLLLGTLFAAAIAHLFCVGFFTVR